MPVIDGIQTAKLIRQFYLEDVELKIEDLPLVYGVSGHTEDEYKKQAKKNGIKDILEKPLYLSNLRNVLREVSIL